MMIEGWCIFVLLVSDLEYHTMQSAAWPFSKPTGSFNVPPQLLVVIGKVCIDIAWTHTVQLYLNASHKTYITVHLCM